MSFQPVIPTGGIIGWRFLQRTYQGQFQSFSSSAVNERETKYFLDNIGKVKTAEQLVSDRRLLQVALGAFGLEGDVDNRFFIRKILEDGTQADDALSNRLADKRYREFSDAFGFGPGAVRKTVLVTNMEEIAQASLSARFEITVGQSDETMRISLYAQRELSDLAKSGSSTDTKWFDLMGLPPLRKMMETALGLPPSFAQLDIDKQLVEFKSRLFRLTGSDDLAQFSDQMAVEKLTDTYLTRSQIAGLQSTISPAQTALILLGAV